MSYLAVDAMGGDYAPEEIVVGALRGAKDFDLGINLVGDPDMIKGILAKHKVKDLQVVITPSKDVIHFNENPARAVRSRPGASINIACNLVLEGKAQGVITMGHTGAGMIAAMFNFGRIPGVERPAFIVPLLGLKEDCFLIDVGGNTDVRPRQLVNFAYMGSAYAMAVSRLSEPRVGLLSNGEEANKGNRVTQKAYQLLRELPDLNFVGNIEGHALLNGGVDVIVADGFSGNILFKALEGLVPHVIEQVAEIVADLPPESATILKTHLEKVSARNHYSRYGVSALLGVQYPMFIGHGRSKAEAVRNGMLTAKKMIAGNVIDNIRHAFHAELEN